MTIEFKQLREIRPSDIIELMNNPHVRRHMPLAKEAFDEAAYHTFIVEKTRLWAEHGYGPWAFLVDGNFAGWGGLQFEQGDADLALVLHPKYWGLGKKLYEEIIKRAFEEMGLKSVTALLPPSRKGLKALLRLHFKPDGELLIDGERFYRFRLVKPR